MTTDRDAAAADFADTETFEPSRNAELANAFRAGWDAAMEEVADAMPDGIDIYRIIKRSGARKHADIGRAVAAALPQPPVSTGEGA